MDINKYKNLISNTYLFNTFSQDEIINLFKRDYYKIRDYKKGSIIYIQNEICNTIDIILKGTVDIQKIDEDGRVLTVTSFEVGDIMGGNLAFSKTNQYPMTISARTDTSIVHIRRELILNLCQTNKDYLVKFLELLSDKALILTDKISFMSMKSIRDKIKDYLAYECYIQRSAVIELKISKKELAEKFGVQRPSLFRELKKMKEEGLIDYNSRQIIILDEEIFGRFK